jgi:VCBS repeat-containing protein
MPSLGRRCPIRHLQPFRRSIAAIFCLTLLPLSSASGAGRHRSVSPPTAQLTANPDAYAAGQGKALAVVAAKGVLVNDRDPQGKPLIALLAANPRHGTLTFNADGSFTYTNDGTGAASDSFTYQASNGTALSNIATVTITIGGADAITAAADSYSLPHGGNITVAAPGVLANDLDPNGAPLTASAAALPAHGSLTLNPNGSFTYAHDGTNTTSDSFSYRASDGTLPAAIGAATLTIGTDTAPVVASQTYTTTQNTPLTVAAPGVLTGAVDPDSPAITALLQTPASHGAVSLNPNGSFVYTPATGYAGADSFTYRGSDGIVTSANAGTAAITVSAIPRPSAADDRYVATTPTLTIAAPGILGNDTINGAPIISFGINGNDQNGIGHPAVTARNGQITLNADGSFVYNAPSATFAGDDTFKYIVSNAAGSATGTVTITVAPVNTKCPGMTIGPSTLSAAAAGSVYPAVNFTLTGGASPVIWAAGTLPAGMTLSNAGVLSGTPAAIGSFNITVMATDANSCVVISTLTLTAACPAIAITATNLAPGTAGVAYPPFSLSESGGTAPITWSLMAGAMPAGMILSYSGALSGTPAQTGIFAFTVRAVDANGCAGTRDLLLAVNAKCPAVTITPNALPGGAAGVVYPAVSFAQFGGAAPVTWSAGTLPPGMSFSNAGVLSGTPSAIGVFNVTVTATDTNGCAATASLPFGINITCPLITIAAANLPAATTGVAYPAIPLLETGGIGPFTWTVSSGTLPAGMTLSTAGVLSGVPTQTASFLFTVKATDTNGCFGAQMLSLVVNPKCPVIVIAPAALTGGTPGVVYPATSFSQTGGTLPVTWSSGTLPPGMSFSNAGVLSGTPTSIGVFNITVTAVDANGCAATVTLPLSFGITCPSLTITALILAAATAGVAYPPVTLLESGGVAPINWSVALGSLPTGMALSRSGILSGTPVQPGTFTFKVQVTDANGCTATKDLSLTVDTKCSGIFISGTPPNGKAGSVYPTFNFSETGGVLPVTWASGVLPAGMSLSTAGVLSGTPIVQGTFTLVLQVTDANGCAGTVSVSFVVDCPAISINASTTIGPSILPAGTAGVLYGPIVFRQTGGAGDIVWSLASGTLPAGITFSNAGTLSGTPVRAGTSTIGIKATDANGCSSTASFTLTIGCQSMSVTNPAATTGRVNVPFTAAFTQSGGQGTTTFATASTLPAGLSLATTGILSGSPAQTGTFPITVTATDSGGCSASSSGYTLVISCGTITVTNPATTAGSTGAVFNQSFAAGGTIGTTSYTVPSGTLPAGLTLATNGVLSGTPSQTGTFAITVKATDANSCSGTGAAYNLAIACGANTVNNPSTATGSIGTAFSQTFSANNTNGVLTFTTPSALPAGLTLDPATGTLSGTPIQSGTFPIVVTVTDGNGCSGTAGAPYILVIDCAPITVTNPISLAGVIPDPTTNGVTGTAFNVTFTQSGGVAPITFNAVTTLVSALAHPAGVAVSRSSGDLYIADTIANAIKKWTADTNVVTTLVSGLIQPAGVAFDGAAVYFTDTGNSAVKKWTAGGGVSQLVSSADVNHPTGIAIRNAGAQAQLYIADTSNNAIKLWTAASGAVTSLVTSGLLNPSGVAVDGAGNVYIADSGHGAIKEWLAPAGPVITLVSGLANPSGITVDSGGNVYIAESGSGAIRKWSAPGGQLTTLLSGLGSPSAVALGPLDRLHIADTDNNAIRVIGTPPGLTISTDGVLSGTPTLHGTFPMTIIATDANGCTGKSTYTLTIACVTITVTNPSTNGGVLNVPFSAQFTQSGAVGTPRFTSTTLLAGLTLNASTGLLSGTPAVTTSSFPLTVTVTDSNFCVSTGAAYSLTINQCRPITISPNNALLEQTEFFIGKSLPPGLGFNQTGAVGTATFSAPSFPFSGSPPLGVTLSTDGSLTGTPDPLYDVGVLPIAITVTDGNGCPQSFTYNMVLCSQSLFGTICP